MVEYKSSKKKYIYVIKINMTVVRSILLDERIGAYNVLVEIKIGEYLTFAKDIIDQNEFQRKKVIKGRIKDILRDDLLRNCLIPSIVLAVSDASVSNIKSVNDFVSAGKIIDSAIGAKNVLIIDGLQRTYVLMNLEEDLIKTKDENALKKLYAHTIRAEIYLGLNRMGLLYRMITLNTGQTTMSTRHLMEILFLDYSRVGIDGINLVKDKDEESIEDNVTSFNFKVILDGFNSYVEKKEGIIERVDILDNIRSLDVISLEDEKLDIFKEFLLTHQHFLKVVSGKSNNWKFNIAENQQSEYKLNSSPFGKSVLDIFKKSQAITGFGAALGLIREQKKLSLADIRKIISNVEPRDNDWNTFFWLLLKQFDLIKEKSKKIGTDQRYFFKFFFRSLINPDSDYYLNMNESATYAYDMLREEKEYK